VIILRLRLSRKRTKMKRIFEQKSTSMVTFSIQASEGTPFFTDNISA
jgi:hypothetical protein